MNKNIKIYIFMAVSICSICTGCNLFDTPSYQVVTSTPYSAPSAQLDGIIGDKIPALDFYLTVTEIETANSYNNLQPKKGNKYIAVELEIESRVDNFEDFNSLYARIKDKDGNLYLVIFGGKEPWIPVQNPLKKGAKVKGWVTFEIPEKRNEFWLIYQSFQYPESRPIIIDITK